MLLTAMPLAVVADFTAERTDDTGPVGRSRPVPWAPPVLGAPLAWSAAAGGWSVIDAPLTTICVVVPDVATLACTGRAKVAPGPSTTMAAAAVTRTFGRKWFGKEG